MNRIKLTGSSGVPVYVDMDGIVLAKGTIRGKTALYTTADGELIGYFTVSETVDEVLRLEEIGLKSKPTSAEIGRLYERINELGRMNHYRNQQ